MHGRKRRALGLDAALLVLMVAAAEPGGSSTMVQQERKHRRMQESVWLMHRGLLEAAARLRSSRGIYSRFFRDFTKHSRGLFKPSR